jgi:nucleoid-associated protein YgaU
LAQATPEHSNAIADWGASLFFPGGNSERLDDGSRHYADLRRIVTDYSAGLAAHVKQLSGVGGWSGQAATAFYNDQAELIQHLSSLAESYDHASRGLADQARQKQQQQYQAEALWVMVGLFTVVAGTIVLAPAAAVAAGGAAVAEGAAAAGGTVAGATDVGLTGVVASTTQDAAAAATEGSAEAVTAAEAATGPVQAALGDAFESLRAAAGWVVRGNRAQLISGMKLSAAVTVGPRAFDKARVSLAERGWKPSGILPALWDGVNPLKWSAVDLSNVLLGTAAAPAIAFSPFARLAARLPVPVLASGLADMSLPAGIFFGELVDGGIVNGGLTGLGSFGLNGEPLTSKDAWGGVATSTATGGWAGHLAGKLAVTHPIEGLIMGRDAAKFRRTLIALPADLSIAAGTASQPARRLALSAPEADPPAAGSFQPRFVGGVRVTVQPGDTLWGIAGNHLQDPAKWPLLVQHVNPKPAAHPRQLRPGDTVEIPVMLAANSPTR